MYRLLIALAASIAVAGLTTGAARADMAYADPAGDGLNSASLVAPDLTTIDVSNTPEGLVTFRVAIANYPTLPPLTGVAIGLDLDRDVKTGDEGVEAFIGYIVDLVGAGQLAFDRWDGSELVEVEPTTATARFENGVVVITVPRSELLDTTAFDFGVVSLTTNLVEFALDFAPNDAPAWTYELTGLTPPVMLTATKPKGAPTAPRAGKPFVVSSTITRSDTFETVSAGSVVCVVRAGATRVRAVGRFRGGSAQCAMTVPKSASRKTLRGTITVSALDTSVSKPFSFRVT